MKRLSRATALAGLLAVGAFVGESQAEIATDRYKVDAEFSLQPTFHHQDVREWDYVQQRQELRLGLVLHGVSLNDRSAGFFRKFDLAIEWRGRYDAIYDLKKEYRDRGYHRPDFRFPEGQKPREAYVDIEFNGFLEDLSLRIGRQQVVWGEADFFRSLDVINPLRLDQMGLVGDDLDNYREPLWIAKALYHLGDAIPGVAGADFEAFWSPDGRPLTDNIILKGGWRILDDMDCFPDSLACTRRNQVPFEQVRHPWEIERVGPEYNTAPDQGELNLDALVNNLGLGGIINPNQGEFGNADFIYLGHRPYGDTDGFNKDGWKEVDPTNRWMAGGRLMGQTSVGGLYFTLNYVYKRAEIPAPYIGWETVFDPNITQTGGYNLRTDIAAQAVAGMLSLDLDQDGVPDGNEDLIRRCVDGSEPMLILGATSTGGRSPYGYQFPTESLGGACVPVKLWYPYTHIVGFTLTYNDFDYTGAILRMEQSLSTKEPRTKYPAVLGSRAGVFPTTTEFYRGGKTETQVWRSMIGFDYLAAVFQHRSVPRAVYDIKLIRSLLTDQWFFTFQFFHEYWARADQQLGLDFSKHNRHQHFNPILTLIMTGFFVNDLLRPTIALAYEVNTGFPVAWIQFQYFITEELQVRIGEVQYMGSSHDENFLFLNHYADRDTAYIRFTYFLL